MKTEFSGLDLLSFEDLAAGLAHSLRPGDVVVLSGEVGAGKTTFTRLAARDLGVKERVTSPTYQLARSYEGFIDGRPVTVNHLDLYRLDGVAVYDALDLDEYLSPDSITFIEWAEPALGVVEEPSVILLEHESSSTRRVTVEGPLARRHFAGEDRP